jgi:hypothetical protein
VEALDESSEVTLSTHVFAQTRHEFKEPRVGSLTMFMVKGPRWVSHPGARIGERRKKSARTVRFDCPVSGRRGVLDGSDWSLQRASAGIELRREVTAECHQPDEPKRGNQLILHDPRVADGARRRYWGIP